MVGCILTVIRIALEAMWFVIKLVYKVLIFLLFRLGLFLVALYVAGLDVLDRFIYAGQLDIYGKNLVFYLIGMALTVAATVLLWYRRKKRAKS